MDVDSSQARMAAYMRDHQDKVTGRWCELVVTGLRGRTSAAEIRRELDDLYGLVLRTMSGADEQAAGELRAALAELSRSRARNARASTKQLRPSYSSIFLRGGGAWAMPRWREVEQAAPGRSAGTGVGHGARPPGRGAHVNRAGGHASHRFVGDVPDRCRPHRESGRSAAEAAAGTPVAG